MTGTGGKLSGFDLVFVAVALFIAMDKEEVAMAYLRGSSYVWSDGRRVHVWVGDGNDGWTDSGWAEGMSSNASGVSIDCDAMDQFVMMRFAELIRDRTARTAAERAIAAHHGNGGCSALEDAWSGLSRHVAALEGQADVG